MKYSIYSISDWAATTDYEKHDIVNSDSFYYYASVNHTSAAAFNIDYNDGKWLGKGTDSNGEEKPQFIWTPAYNSPVNFKPRTKTIVFGDGYEQRIRDGINSNLLTFNLRFEGKTLQEATAICHFLYARDGVESFLWTPPAPFNAVKRFKCEEWEPDPAFYDNWTITASFKEVVN